MALSRINSSMIGAGDVSNTEHAYLNSVSSNVQTQIDGAGGLVYLGATTSGSQRDYTSQITATYDQYLMLFQLAGDNAGDNMAIQVYVSGSLQTGSTDYGWNSQVGESDTATISGSASDGDDLIRMAKTGQSNAGPLIGFIRFHRTEPYFHGMLNYKTTTGDMAFSTFGGVLASRSDIDGVRLLMDGGVFQGGTARLYGVVNS